jgi:predicted AlkP superfamily phosphohydrolase/phosphomutase
MIRQRTAAVKYLAHSREWDLLTVVYGAADRVSHKFWKYMDEGHPTLQAGRAGVIPQVYRMLDEAVDELVNDLADERTLVILVSDHGFGPLKKALFLNQWLAEQGYLAFREQTALSPGERVRVGINSTLRRAVHWLDRPWMGTIKRTAFDLFPGLKGKLHSSMAYARVDWSRTRAYGSGTMGNIYLNVRGREPGGIVEPGEEYETVRAGLIEALQALRDPETGRCVFDAVYRREDIYHGPYLDLAPDIVGLLDPTYHIAAVDWRQAGGGVIASLEDDLLFVGDLTGQHDMDGILIAHGPSVRRGVEVAGVGIVDIAPTILATLGEPIPEEMDGRVAGELFSDEIRSRPATGASGASTPRPEDDIGDGYSDEEADEVAARLRGLGYVD